MHCPICNKFITPDADAIRVCRGNNPEGFHHFYFENPTNFSLFFENVELHALNNKYTFIVEEPRQIIKINLDKIEYCEIMEIIDRYMKMLVFS